MTPEELIARYVELHNLGKWEELGALFGKDAVLAFLGVMLGPFMGRDAIAQSFVDNPPRDRLVILSIVPVPERPGTFDARYAWSSAPATDAGTLRFVCALGAIAALLVTVRA